MKTLAGYGHTSNGIARIKKKKKKRLTKPSVGEDVERLEPAHTAVGSVVALGNG